MHDYKYRMRNSNRAIILSCLFLAVFQVNSFAEESVFNSDSDFAQVVAVRMVHRSGGSWDVHTAVLHNDQGWDHYADIWQIVDAEKGTVLGERILAHPHDNEQPFTRSLSGVKIPGSTGEVIIRSRCNRHDYGGKEIHVVIPGNPELGLELNITK
jgi:hypothetical protein